MRAGKIKAYAVTSEARSAISPEIPTFRESRLPALSISSWYGLFAPRGTPKDILGKLNAAVVEALADATVRSRLTEFGFEVFPREEQTPERLEKLVKSGIDKWRPIIKNLGIRAQ
jgi:tripartite-type tricarboxylate transporter receptor subunit TctC